MDKPAEILLYDFLYEAFASSPETSLVYSAELHDTIYQTITKPRCVRISDTVSDLSPVAGMEMREFDAQLVIAGVVKVPGKQKAQRQACIQEVFDLQREICDLLILDSTLGGRVCDSLIRTCSRGFDVLAGEPYAVVNIPMVINPRSAGY